MYLYNVNFGNGNFGFVSVFLFEEQFNTRMEKPDMLRSIRPFFAKIEDGQIRNLRELKENEFVSTEFQDKASGRKFMRLFLNGIQQDVYFDTFYSLPYDRIIDLLNQGKEVCDDLLLACFKKHTDEIAAIVELISRDILLTGCMSLCSADNTRNVLCVPKSTKQYPKENWSNKMTFAPIQEAMSLFAASLTTYTDDICSMINRRIIKLVNKQEYIDKLNEAGKKAWIQAIKKANKKSIFKKKKDSNMNIIRVPSICGNTLSSVSAVQVELLDERISCLVSDTKIA